MTAETEQSYNENGTPPGDSTTGWPTSDYYEQLQVSPRAETEVIEAAYKRLALKYHPDKNPSPEATRRMQEINEAYSVLSNPARRVEYDALRNAPFVDVNPGNGATDSGSASAAPRENRASPGTNQSAAYDWDSFEYEGPPRKRPWQQPMSYLLAAVIFIFIAATGLALAGNSGAANQTPSPETPTPLPEGVLFYDDFDTVGTANWSLDTPWHLTSRLSASGKYALWVGDEEQGRYAPGLNASATLVRPLDLGGFRDPILSFDLQGQTDEPAHSTGQDKLVVEIAEPGHDFQTVQTFSGLVTSWQMEQVNLSKWQGKLVLVRVRFVSGPNNASTGYSGFFLDNFKVGK